MIAALPMYDPLPLRDANDRFWALVREALGYGPARLDRFMPPQAVWRSPALVLSQTCSMPYRLGLHGAVHVVAAPDYNLPGCGTGQYNSVLVARRDDPRDAAALVQARVAVNEAQSQSGYAALWGWADMRGLRLGPVLVTGGHLASIRAVAEGRADIAAIDAHTWRLACLHDPACARLRELDRTAPAPALPYITALSNDPTEIADALVTATEALDGGTRARLGLRGIVPADVMGMLALRNPPPLAATL